MKPGFLMAVGGALAAAAALAVLPLDAGGRQPEPILSEPALRDPHIQPRPRPDRDHLIVQTSRNEPVRVPI